MLKIGTLTKQFLPSQVYSDPVVNNRNRVWEGVVVYINYEFQWLTIEFTVFNHKFRESFFLNGGIVS